MSSIKEQIVILEKRLQGYKNNYEFAVKNNNKIRQTKYANIIREVELEIKQLEREIPIESNERLRKIIDGQNEAIAELRKELEGVKESNKELNQRIEDFINPPKKEEPKEPTLEHDIMHECPACGRSFKGAKGVKIHQSSGACKAAH